MRKITFILTVSFLQVFLMCSAVLAAKPVRTVNPIEVTSIEIQFAENIIIIYGKEFTNGYNPNIIIGNFSVDTLSSSFDMIVGKLPNDLKPGDYLLSITTGPDTHQFISYALTIGAVGPEGPQGLQGEIGPQGPVGPSPRLCTPGDFVGCYSGPAGTRDIGACKPGFRTCLGDGTGFGVCAGEVLPELELCDGVDNNCNGLIDDTTDAVAWYQDSDLDEFGNPDHSTRSCTQPAGFIAAAGDCNDSLNSIHPNQAAQYITKVGGEEICDGLDNNCDGMVDNDCLTAACTAQDMHNFNNQSLTCLVNPSADTCNWDGVSCLPQIISLMMCSENSCISSFGLDVDCIRNHCRTEWEIAFGPVPASCSEGETKPCGSGTGECRQGTQACTGGTWGNCTGGVGPAEEICGDEKDNNCDGQVDENGLTWYLDTDGDGYGNPWFVEMACTQLEGYVENGADCDDADSAIHPGAVEMCDNLDNNCDGQVDENALPWYLDADGDGYGNPWYMEMSCTQPEGYVGNGEDCNDADSASHPGAVEMCDGLDNDCDGQVDENKATWFQDADGDGYGNPWAVQIACTQPDGYVEAGEDCDDADSVVHPGAVEMCDGRDNDCDGVVNNGYETGGACGYGQCEGGVMVCSDDGAGTICSTSGNASPEVCDGMDNNCDGTIDEDCLDEKSGLVH